MSLALRAAVAVLLMVLFVALALGTVIALLFVGQAVLGSLGHVRGRGMLAVLLLGLGCFVAAGVIVWSIFPRPDRFEPPGPEVGEADQPALFAEIRRIARATGEAMPSHVYLMWDINAFVAQRGGMMGFGSRRVMGIGMPLLRVLNVSELRAVLAHEMGHFYGGDTRLGPWIYKTRGSVLRTVINLARASGQAAQVSQLVQLLFVAVLAPFRWFGTGFMRVSQAISRAQELSADRVAARCEGAPSLIGGLKKTQAAALAHQIFMSQEVLPLVADGALPPVGEGFSRFLGTTLVSKLLDEAVDSELREGKSDPYDSHPPLRERIEALEGVAGPAGAPDLRPAIGLVTGAEKFEHDLIASQILRRVEPIAWDEAPRLWEQKWRKMIARHKGPLGGITVAGVPAQIRSIFTLATALEGHDFVRQLEDDDAARGWATQMLGAALCVLLIDAGYALSADIGEPIRCTRAGETIEPYRELGAYLRGETSAAAWRARWEALGFADRALAS